MLRSPRKAKSHQSDNPSPTAKELLSPTAFITEYQGSFSYPVKNFHLPASSMDLKNI